MILHDRDPLLPVDPPRRVVLYHCRCGIAGCSGRACVISEANGVVRWTNFLRFVGLNHPLDDSLADEHGQADDLPDFSFDAAQYWAEVEQAKENRSWETSRRRLARLLTSRLQAETQRWEELGYQVRSIWLWNEDEDVDAINLRRQDDHLVIGIRAVPGADEEATVQAMADEVLVGDEHSWFTIYD